jgi:hypothetical protein
VPTGDGSRGDPTSDFDGSGVAFLTEDGAGNTDVDGGPTRLLSPRLDLSQLSNPHIRCARWMSNDDGDDLLVTEISRNDGATWTLIDSINSTGGWSIMSLRVADYVVPSAQVRVRFSVADDPNDSVTEAAIDAFEVFTPICDSIQMVDVTAVFGSMLSGGVAEIIGSDNQYLVIRSAFGFSATEPNIVDARAGAISSNTEIDAFDATVEAKLNNPGGAARLRVRNWQTQAFEQIGQFQIGTTEITRFFDEVDAENRVRQLDGRIELSLRMTVIATFSAEGFTASIDRLTATLD